MNDLDYSALTDAELARAYIGATTWRQQSSTPGHMRELRAACQSVLAIIDEQSKRSRARCPWRSAGGSEGE